MMELFASVGLGIMIFSAIYLAIQLYSLVNLDANYRDIKSPGLWAAISLSGNAGEGLLLYLLKRRSYPRREFSTSDQEKFLRLKNKAKATSIFAVFGLALFLIGLNFFN